MAQKVSFEEQLMRLKERVYKQTVEIQGYQERNQILKEQMLLFRQRITELEKESLAQHKENYALNCELDYEAVKAKELQAKNDNLLNGYNLSREAELKDREQLVAKYEYRTQELERKMKEERARAAGSQGGVDSEIARLSVEVERLQAENQ